MWVVLKLKLNLLLLLRLMVMQELVLRGPQLLLPGLLQLLIAVSARVVAALKVLRLLPGKAKILLRRRLEVRRR